MFNFLDKITNMIFYGKEDSSRELKDFYCIFDKMITSSLYPVKFKDDNKHLKWLICKCGECGNTKKKKFYHFNQIYKDIEDETDEDEDEKNRKNIKFI